MKLTVVFACLNDAVNAVHTIASIRETAGNEVDIVVVDDASATPLSAMIPFEHRNGARIIENRMRCGCGPSRHIGVLNAFTEWVLICDSHMVFQPGWYDAFQECIGISKEAEKIVWCGTCLGTDDLTSGKFDSEYCAGTLNILGPDRANPSQTQVLEGVWNPPGTEDCAEIPCVMGANYAIRRDWFLRLDALRHLRQWGCDEQMLSIKSWLAGGECRYAKGMRVGHLFRTKNQPFRISPGYPAWNKLFAIHTLCPPDLAGKLEAEFKKTMKPQEWAIAQQMLRDDWHIIATEQANNRRLFTQNLRWLAKKFSLNCP